MADATLPAADTPPQPDGMTRWLAQCRDDNREVARQAQEKVYRYLEQQLLGVALRRAGMNPDNPLSPRDLFHEVVAAMLGAGMPYENTEHLRRAFCAALYHKAIDHLRRRAHQAIALNNDPTGRDTDPGRRLEAAENLNLLDRAVAELENDRPELADTLKTRFLVNRVVRFDRTGQAFTQACHDLAVDRKRTFAEMGELLGCSLGQAYSRYQEAVRWLRERFPEFTPGDFQGGVE